MKKISDYTEIIKIYNTSGKSEAYEYIKDTYHVKNPYYIVKKIKSMIDYRYDKVADRFFEAADIPTDEIFMDYNELCSNTATQKNLNELTMDVLVKQLIEERLLQLSNYVQMNQASKTVLIDQTSMIADGFKVIIH